MHMCQKCGKMTGTLFLIFGILFLVRDLGGWDFWNIGAWTLIFLMIGMGMFMSSGCPACQKKNK